MSKQLVKFMALSAAALLIPIAAIAVDEHNVSNGLTLDGVPLGLHGVDAVALTSLGAVAEGSATHTVLHDGVAYYFASKHAASAFEANPGGYLPQYGGFCAYAVALGKKLDGDPRFADIVDGKLYLFVNDAIFRKYKENPEKILSKAEQVWPRIQHEAVGSL